jgi:ferredoxin
MRSLTQPRHDPPDVDPAIAARLRSATMRVWIDQDLCTGDGICEDLCPEVFVILDDGIAYVHEGARVMNDPGQETGLARVASEDESSVVTAALACPGECIFIEALDDH